MTIDQFGFQLKAYAYAYLPKLVGAILVWWIGSKIIIKVGQAFEKMLEKKGTDVSLRPFLRSLAIISLKVLLAISALGMLGVEMTSFIAVLGAAGLAIGMALSGSLQNFAGGIIILLFKPFKVGDFIEAQGHLGTVHSIQIFSTILKTPDNKTVIIPNDGLSNSSLTNFSTESTRRVDWVFGIAYGDDLENAKKLMKDLCEQDERILLDPEPLIVLSELADSSVNITVRAWVQSENYWKVFFAMNEKIYQLFPEQNLHIPFPQMDVHLQKD